MLNRMATIQLSHWYCAPQHLYSGLHTRASVVPLALPGFKKEIAMTIKSIAEKLSAWRRYRVSVRELSRLSDRELADLGLGRGDIERVARQAVRVRFFG
jgi:uncharacterized protein YjiS (DUF1127 family)